MNKKKNTNSIEHVRKQLFGLCLRLQLFFHRHELVAMRHEHVFLSLCPEDSVRVLIVDFLIFGPLSRDILGDF